MISSTGQFGGFRVILLLLFSVATSIKLLLIPAYRSTDFEVHRNWLAITHSLPLSKWYYEDTSEWTLDYPPFFAWFEWVLSLPAAVLDPLMVDIQSLNYATPTCIMYQRLTVIFSDITLLYALFQYYQYQTSGSHDKHGFLATKKSLVVSALILFNYGLFIVDHIHFQYNGFLFGILSLSLVRILQGRYLEGGFWFAVLLNLKHIFLYLAPAYFVYLLRHYCFHGNISSLRGFLPWNFVKLGGVVIIVFMISFGPFIYLGQLGQVLSRLFPFKRGLCHAYWAPNLWALYSMADMLIASLGAKFEVLGGSCDADSGGCGSMTSGLVGEMRFKVLPQISPLFAILVTGATMMPGLVKVGFSTKSRPHDFLSVLVWCAYSSFLFGWHVHEKAVLLIIIPMSFLAVEDVSYKKIFLVLSLAGHISLFPLLHQPAETTAKLSLFVLCTCMVVLELGSVSPPLLSSRDSSELAVDTPAPLLSDTEPPTLGEGADSPPSTRGHHGHKPRLLSWLQAACVFSLFLVQVYCIGLHGLGPLRKMEFLPLLLTSVSCAAAVIFSWVQFMLVVLHH